MKALRTLRLIALILFLFNLVGFMGLWMILTVMYVLFNDSGEQITAFGTTSKLLGPTVVVLFAIWLGLFVAIWMKGRETARNKPPPRRILTQPWDSGA